MERLPQISKPLLLLKKVVEQFVAIGDMSPNSAAVFVAHAAENQKKTVPTNSSPSTELLLKRNQIIDESDIQDGVKKRMKQITARTYVNTYRSKNDDKVAFETPPAVTSAKRKLPMGKLPPPVPSKKLCTTETNHSPAKLPPVVSPPPDAANERDGRRKKINWAAINPEETDFTSVEDAVDYIKLEHPSLQNSRTTKNKKGAATYTWFECKFGRRAGPCKARIEAEVGGRVILRVRLQPSCNCQPVEKNGVSNKLKSVLQKVKQTHPTLGPKSVTLEVLKRACSLEQIDTGTPESRLKLMAQLNRHNGYMNEKNGANGKDGQQRITCVSELKTLKDRFTFNLPQQPINEALSSERELQVVGKRLAELKYLQTIPVDDVEHKCYQSYRFMTVLDGRRDPKDTGCSEAEENLYRRIEELQKKKKMELEGVWEKTTVVTSLALLWNIKQCADLNFRVCASADGTANCMANDWKLLNFGCFTVNHHKKDGKFRPFIYILAPEESEIFFAIGIVSFLKYSRRLFGIKNINFELVISDHAPVFVNVFKRAFGNSQLASCWPHISRKLAVGKSNGQYMTLLNKQAFRDKAREDLTNLHECLSKAMFDCYAKMVEEAWLEEDERKLVQTFFASYICPKDYNTWHCGASKLCCCYPSNNPNERNTGFIKGSRQEDPLCFFGRDMVNMIMKQIPKVIYTFSLTLTGVQRSIPVDCRKHILQTESKQFKRLSEYVQNFNDVIDCQITYDKKPNVWLLNAKEYLGTPITREREQTHDDALLGKTKYSPKDRHKYINSVKTLCKVTIINVDGEQRYRGSCVEFIKTGYCEHSAFLAYRADLLPMCEKIPSNKKKKPRSHRRSHAGSMPLTNKEKKHNLRCACECISQKVLDAICAALEFNRLDLAHELRKLPREELRNFKMILKDKAMNLEILEKKLTQAEVGKGLADNILTSITEASNEPSPEATYNAIADISKLHSNIQTIIYGFPRLA